MELARVLSRVDDPPLWGGESSRAREVPLDEFSRYQSRDTGCHAPSRIRPTGPSIPGVLED